MKAEHIATKGLYRVPMGWAGHDSAVVIFSNRQKFEMPRDQYEAFVNSPPFDSLPTQEDYNHAATPQRYRR